MEVLTSYSVIYYHLLEGELLDMFNTTFFAILILTKLELSVTGCLLKCSQLQLQLQLKLILALLPKSSLTTTLIVS